MSSGALSLLSSSGTLLTKTSPERRALATLSCCRAIRKKSKANFSSNKVNCDQDLALGVSMEVNTVLLPRQWELVCIHLSEFEAEPLQAHPTDLTVVTRRDDPFDKIVHLVPVVALGQCASNSFRSDVEQREVFLLDEPFSLFQGNDDPSTSLIVFDHQEPVWESGWSFKQTPLLGISVSSCCPIHLE
jgi:hypothetical protein